MINKLYVTLWNWQSRHTTPRWIDMNTGEVVSHIGRFMSGRYIDREHTFRYRWVSLVKYNRGMI